MKFLARFNKLPANAKLFAASALVMAAAVCKILSYTWASRQDYSFGYIAPIFVLYVLWIRREEIFGYFLNPSPEKPRSRAAEYLCGAFFGAMFACGIAVYAAFGLLFFLTQNRGVPSFTMTFGFSFSAFAMAYFASATDSAGNRKPVGERLKFTSLFVFPCFIWLVAAPLFGSVEEIISLKLLSIVAAVDYSIMDALGYLVTLRGNVIEFPKGSVGVAEACSGIRSLTACIFAGSFLAAAMLEKFWKQIALVISSMALAFFFNLCRALFLAMWAYENGSDAIGGAVHDTAGYIILGCTVAGLLVLVSIFNINPVPEEFRNKPPAEKK